MVIDVPASSQVHRQVVRKDADARVIELNPVVRLHYVQVKEPDMHDPSGDLRRLFEALDQEWGLKDSGVRFVGAAGPAERVARGSWQVTVAVHAEKQIIGVWPGLHEHVFGLAVDVGSTTIAAHLCDLTSGEVVASARHHESADPLRRGSDEPRVLFDDEPGRRRADDRRRSRSAVRPRDGCGARGGRDA